MTFPKRLTVDRPAVAAYCRTLSVFCVLAAVIGAIYTAALVWLFALIPGAVLLYFGATAPKRVDSSIEAKACSPGGSLTRFCVVTACRERDQCEDDRSLEELGWTLLAAPYEPNRPKDQSWPIERSYCRVRFF